MHFCMDWQSVTFDWNQVRAFLVTAEEGSFSAASRALGLTQPTLGRQVADSAGKSVLSPSVITSIFFMRKRTGISDNRGPLIFLSHQGMRKTNSRGNFPANPAVIIFLS